MNRSPLHDAHKKLGARFIEFGGWEMPLQYSGVVEEHKTVRAAAGLFDVSHLGRIEVAGPDAFRLLNNIVTAELAGLSAGTIAYTFFCNEEGGILDDVLIYRRSSDFLICANAANREKILDWLATKGRGMTLEIRDVTMSTAQLALQGPLAKKLIAEVCDRDCDILTYHHFVTRTVAGKEVMVARSGYTGEIGFELVMAAGDAGAVWDAILAAGTESGLKPAGLGARDTLRLEAGLTLYGHDIDETTSPMEAGLQRFVNLEKGGFEGKTPLSVQRAIGVKRRLVGLVLEDKGIPREGCTVYRESDGNLVEVGVITSGNFSPSLGKGIALAYVASDTVQPGLQLVVGVRDKRFRARLVEPPFYRRGK
ncbi:MAG: glycine cleavage system aminomethyltransferase GcvT [Nitrospirota bacterium]|nr:glycine cleavage system aminomethyltransferase GcvT [Nitrospirota bacterium]